MVFAGRNVRLIIVLVLAALAGLVVLQGYLLAYALEVKDRAFRRNVHAALASTVDQLATGEVAGELFRQVEMLEIRREDDQADDFVAKVTRSQRGGADYVYEKARIDTLIFAAQGRWPQVTIVAEDPLREIHTDHEFSFFADTLNWNEEPHVAWVDERESLVRRVLLNMTSSRQPIRERLADARLDSVLAASLGDVGIEADFAYAVRRDFPQNLHYGGIDPLVVLSDSTHADALNASEFTARLYPQDTFAPTHELMVHFPGERNFVRSQVLPMLAAIVAFMSVIVGCFVYSIRTIFAQRRFASRMVGFINNMTHEFKTPISTVALATEAISRPDVAGDQKTVRRYNRMIREENARMHQQVDKILEMATLEKGDYELNRVEVDLHELLTDVAESFDLRVRQRGGEIDLHLEADEAVVRADLVHLTSIVHNLLDNAEKYSPEAPRIEVATASRNGELRVSVADRGIGIAAEDRRRVFERYFRCATGNQHDVKGFGLGLSYVQLMVEAHGGRVDLRSRPGDGTTVEVYLPLNRAKGEVK